MNGQAHLYAKFARASEHLQQLEHAALNYLQHVSTSMDPTSGGARQVVSDPITNSYVVTLTLPEPPVEISLMLGDFIHNLRSSLDYLSRELVHAAGRSPIDGIGGTTFPILKKAANKELDIKPGTWPEARAILERVQPYSDPEKRGDRHPLAMLNELDNKDKHRLLNVTALSGAGGVAFVRPPASASVTTQEQRRHRIELRSGVPQRVEVEPDEMFDPAEMAGMWTYSLVLDEEGIGRRDNVLGMPRALFEYVYNEVIDPMLIAMRGK